MARPGLSAHPKFKHYVRLLGEPRPHARGYLEVLWDTAYEDGNPVIGTPEQVESVAEYDGPKGKLFNALLNAGGDKAGFIEPVDGRPGVYQIHELLKNAPDYVKKRQKRAEERESNNSCPPNGAERRRMADNGGQRRTTAEHVRPPGPSLPGNKSRSARASGTKRAGAYAGVTGGMLADTAALSAWCDNRGIQSDADRLNVFTAAERALELGRNPASFFVKLVKNRQWHLLSNAQEDRARARLRELARAPPVPESVAEQMSTACVPPTE